MAAQNIAAKPSKISFFMELSPFGWSGKPSLAAVGWVVCLAAESILGHRRLKLERKKAGGFLGFGAKSERTAGTILSIALRGSRLRCFRAKMRGWPAVTSSDAAASHSRCPL